MFEPCRLADGRVWVLKGEVERLPRSGLLLCRVHSTGSPHLRLVCLVLGKGRGALPPQGLAWEDRLSQEEGTNGEGGFVKK